MRRAVILTLVVASAGAALGAGAWAPPAGARSTNARSANRRAAAKAGIPRPTAIYAPKGLPPVATGPAAGRRAHPHLFGTNYFYVAAFEYTSAAGAAATFSQPRPWVGGSNDHSLGEIAVESADSQQIVEVGWIVMSGDPTPRLFVFHWVNGIGTCYDACGWVQVSATRMPGMPVTIGALAHYEIEYIKGNWWIGYQGQWMGYFPGSLWSGSFTRVGLTQWFGEVASARVVPMNDMGDGVRGSVAGSASINDITLVGGPTATPDGFTITNTAYYDIGHTGPTSFRFGGPGSGIQTTTQIHASAATSSIGKTVTFTGSVLPVASTGSVSFFEGGNEVGTGTLKSGTAQFAAPYFPAGANQVIATYDGDATHKGSTSSAVTLQVNGHSGLVVGAGGALHWFSVGAVAAPPAIVGAPTWTPNTDTIRGVALLPNGTGGFVLGADGAFHWFSLGTTHTAPAVIGAPTWPAGTDGARGIALVANGTGGFVVGAGGALHWFSLGTAHAAPTVIGAPAFPAGSDPPRGVALLANGHGGYIVDSNGGLHWFSLGIAHAAPPLVGAPTWPPGVDGARGIAFLPNGSAGYVIGASGVLHWFSVGDYFPPAPAIGAPSWPAGIDGARGVAL